MTPRLHLSAVYTPDLRTTVSRTQVFDLDGEVTSRDLDALHHSLDVCVQAWEATRQQMRELERLAAVEEVAS
jgi:hypothetical protein